MNELMLTPQESEVSRNLNSQPEPPANVIKEALSMDEQTVFNVNESKEESILNHTIESNILQGNGSSPSSRKGHNSADPVSATDDKQRHTFHRHRKGKADGKGKTDGKGKGKGKQETRAGKGRASGKAKGKGKGKTPVGSSSLGKGRGKKGHTKGQ